jgi:predicted dehydrogenase
MAGEKKLKAGVIGLGVGRKHLDVYTACPEVGACIVTDLDQAKAKEAAAASARTTVARDAAEILRDPTVDIVSIASYDNVHAAQVAEALSAGKHVFVEKPLCLSVDEAIKIRQILGKNKGLRLSSNLPLRACPRFIAVKGEMVSGRCGEVYAVRADYLWGRVEKLTSGWRPAMPFYSIVYGAAVHIIDLVMWLIGERPVMVRGVGNQIVTKGTALKFNDFASLAMTFKNGLVAEISAHGGCVHPHFHRLEVYGSRKTFLQGLTGATWVTGASGHEVLLPVKGDYPAKETRGDVLRSFLDVLSGSSKTPMVSEEDVFNTMSVCFAAEESIRSGRPMKVEYL